jgi:hypothetical protein
MNKNRNNNKNKRTRINKMTGVHLECGREMFHANELVRALFERNSALNSNVSVFFV